VLNLITRPELAIYSVCYGDAPVPMVIVLPGGGYNFMSDDHEGVQIAKWLKSIGYSAAVLTYRIPDKPDAAYADVQRSIRVLRSRAEEFNIDTNRLGAIGFSAGAHLAARLSSRYAFNSYRLLDDTDSLCSRPDFAMLIYPAYLVDGDGTPTEEVMPHADQPPLFLIQTQDDPFDCAKDYAAAASTLGVKTRLVTYDIGGHGYGLLSDPILPVNKWPREAEEWLKEVVGLPQSK
jgi:acetyl esterase/lipase